MPLKRIIIFLGFLFFFVSCTKQSPQSIEDGFTETIERERLDACSRMNLFNNLFEKNNIIATFDCTDWSKEFPVLRKQTGEFSTENWNSLLLPISTRALNDRNVLKQAIAVTQVLEEQEGLDDLGQVITALSDTNFYDGMNELFTCAANEKCLRTDAPVKNDIVEAFGILEVLRSKAREIQILGTYAVASLDELSSSFSNEVMKVLTSEAFIQKRVELLDLLVSFITQPRTSLERVFLPQVFVPDSQDERGTLFTWLNSDYFGPKLFKEMIKFTERYPLAVKDLRSLGQVRDTGLKCETQINAGFFVDLDKHVFKLLEKIRDLDKASLSAYLADDLSMHQLATQACPNFRNIQVEIDGSSHILDVVRMKKAMIDFLIIPGVYELTRIAARDLLIAANGDERLLGDFMAAQMSENYIGAGIDWLEIIDATAPSLFDEYTRYLKAFPATSFSNLSSVMTHLVSTEQDRVWPAISKLWFFFTSDEKNFVFNYLDKHFAAGTNYKALFTYYLDVYSILLPSFGEIVADWRDNGNDVKNFDGLKEAAYRFHGEEALEEFKKFFSRSHILKVIELFVNNGEVLTAWAQEVRSALPIVIRNQASFEFSTSSTSLANQCLNAVAASDLTLLIKSFPSACRPLEGQTLLEKIEIVSRLSKSFHDSFGFTPFESSSLLAPAIVENFIVLVKRSFDAAARAGASALEHLEWLKLHITNRDTREILTELNSLSSSFPKESSQLLQEKLQLEVASYLKNKDKLARLSNFTEKAASWRKNSSWKEVINRNYPSKDMSRTCSAELNQSIGGTPCPDLNEFQKFIANFTELLGRKNDDSPIAARLFLDALDPAAGFHIPYQAITTTAKNLSIEESLRMFWELSDRSRPVNNKILTYEDRSGKHDQNVTTMERIEIVIRDVNFDANYLGAHYKNSVAKSYDYLKVVNSKYDLFKVCVGAGFCGKFMNRSEKKMARNAVAAFPSLMDVHQNGLEFGDYMKALLGSVVASSSKASQISSIVRFRRDRDGFNIPWIQTKKQLRKHNGVILSELAGVGAFSNMARWTRDRFGRTESDFKKFISSPELMYVSKNLFKGFSEGVSDESLVGLLTSVRNNTQLTKDIWEWVSSLEYEELRRVEDFVGDILVVASAISKNNPHANWDRLIKFATWGIDNYTALKVHWGEQKLFDVIASVQPITDFIASGLLSEEEAFAPVLVDLYQSFEKVFLDESERVNILTLLNQHFNANHAKSIAKIVVHSSHLIKREWTYDDQESFAGMMALASAISTKHGGLDGFAQYLEQTANKRACRYEGELVICQNNVHYLEINKLLGVITKDQSSWDDYVSDLFSNLDRLSEWMTDSLSLIRLQ